jgi:hypothetical protein
MTRFHAQAQEMGASRKMTLRKLILWGNAADSMNSLRISPLVAGVVVIATVVACSSPRSAAMVPQPAPTVPLAAAQTGHGQVPAAGNPTTVQVEASDRVAPKRSKKLMDPAIQRMLRTVDPARIYDTAHPGPGVPSLTIVGPSDQRIHPGDSAPVAMQTAPESLVTFSAKDGGLFPNQQSSITVLADEQGIATTSILANPGTVDDVYVFAGSPAAVGTICTIVHVLYPDSPLVTVTQP